MRMEIEIIKEKRKTLLLRVTKDGNVLVKAPLRYSDSGIQTFLASKKGWIEKQIKRQQMLRDFASGFHFDNLIYQNSIPIMETKTLRLDFEKLSEKTRLKTIKKEYLSFFQILKDRTLFLAQKFGFSVEKISPCSSSVKWGSYSSTGELKLNYKLIILPSYLVDYVITHELCHIRHMNHKPQFWREVEKYYPSYKRARKDMNLYSFVLKTKF